MPNPLPRSTRAAGALSLVVLLGLAGCPENNFTEIRQYDRFQQSRRNSVDLLVVIDNSCSMVEEQDNLASNFDTLIGTFTRADVDWRIAVTTTDTEVEQYKGLLMGGDDEVILRGLSGEIDRVEWDRAWLWTPGTSLQLNPEKYKWNSNDTTTNWCPSTTDFGSGSKGTPGEWNPTCTGTAWSPPAVESDDGPRAPTSGNLIVTEIMAASAGQDSLCEWFELTNTTDDTLALDSLVISDRGRNRVTVASGTEVGPYGVIVVGRSAEQAENCGTPVDLAYAEGLSLAQDIRVIDNTTPDGDELFSELVAQGTIGTGIEMGLEAARLVFEEPYLTEHNQGFMREEANFSVLFVSDEEDFSPYPADAYVRYFSDLKGDRAYRDRSVVNLSAVVGKEPPPRDDLPSCETADGVAWYGKKYLAVANETNGLVESICADDFAPIVEKLGLTLSGLSVDFELSEWPQLDSMRVNLYSGDTEDTLVRELQCGVDFTYVVEGNYLHFEEEQVPPSEHYVVADYEQLAASDRPTAEVIAAHCGGGE